MSSGPKDLTQYFVKSLNIADSHNNNTEWKDDENTVFIVIVLGRKILNEVLLTYLPTGKFQPNIS